MARMYKIIRSRIEYLVIILLTTALVAVVITLATPSEYEASARILVVQKQQSVDAYTASKSADYIAGVLDEAIYSNSFVDSLVASDKTVASKLSSDTSKRSKEWANKVNSSVINNKGILSLKVYDGDAQTALHFASVIVSTITSEGANYYGGNATIDLRVIDNPSVTSKPARPSLPLNVAASLLIGLALDVVYIFILDVRLSRKLEEREIEGRLQNEVPVPENIEFLRDEHIVPRTRLQEMPERIVPLRSEEQGTPQQQVPENLPIAENPENSIKNWMNKN